MRVVILYPYRRGFRGKKGGKRGRGKGRKLRTSSAPYLALNKGEEGKKFIPIPRKGEKMGKFETLPLSVFTPSQMTNKKG